MSNENPDLYRAPAEPTGPGTPDTEVTATWAQQVREEGAQRSQWVDPGIGAALAFGTAPADYPAEATFSPSVETVSERPAPPSHAAAPPHPAHDALRPPAGEAPQRSAHEAPAYEASAWPPVHPSVRTASCDRTAASSDRTAPDAFGPASPQPSAPQPAAGAVPAPALTPAPASTRRGERRGWASLGATAAAAALLASMGTATLTGAFDEESPFTATGSSEQVVNAVPVSATSEDPDWAAVAAAVRESVVALDVATTSGQGAGSGVILDAEGHVLTNNHVVDGARPGGIVVSLADGRMYEAEIVGSDPTTDLAVVRLVEPPSDLAEATLGTSDDLVVGEPVVAVGNPLGLSSTVTTGIVSALDRPVTTAASDPRAGAVVTNAIQVDAAINPGNSGGPLFDATGRVIGITSSIATLSGGGASGSIGLGFAIPIDQASQVATQLIESGAAQHAFLGVGLADTTTTADGTTRPGALVQRLEPGAPAARAGVREGDVITSIDGDSVGSAASLTGYVRQYASGETVTLTVVRDGTTTEVDVTLAAREQIGA